MIAFTISPSFFFRAFTALALVTPACDITSSISLGSTPSSSTSSFSPSSAAAAVGAAAGGTAALASGVLNCSAAADWAWADKSSILASPKIMCVSEDGLLNTSGLEMTKRMFLDFLTVTRMMPGTGRMPSFCMALRLFFSLRFCLPDPAGPASASAPPAGAAPSGCSSKSGISSLSSSTSSTTGFSCTGSSAFAGSAIIYSGEGKKAKTAEVWTPRN
mmetsp:Transcript_7937/g.12136  ORF Transcript_7937/g.12136 Transcript_7937/m.12136 type:complete len:217 (-) Transcript_7937:119-769(-)